MKTFPSLLLATSLLLTAASTAAPPTNDDFANASDLGNASSVIAAGTNVNATGESVEPGHHGLGFRRAMHTVWWMWQAPEDGWVEIDGRESEIVPALAVYTGSSVGLLYQETAGFSRVHFHATAGTRYRLAVDSTEYAGFDRREQGTIQLNLRPLPTVPAANDDFANAISIGDAPSYQITSNNTGATAEPAEPHPIPDSLAARHSLWWSFTPATDGHYRVHLSPESSFLHHLIVYKGDSLHTLVPVNPSWIQYLAVTAGQSYHVVVDSREPGPFDLMVEALTTAPNDDYADAIDLGNAAPPLSFAGLTVGASREPGEPPTQSSFVPEQSIWWTWTPPRTGFYTITPGPDSHVLPNFTVYHGESFASLDFVNYLDNRFTYFHATAGQRLSIVAWSSSGSGGESTILIEEQPLASNDNFADAIDLGNAAPQTVDGHNFGATVEPEEPFILGLEPNSTVWWRWTSPRDGSFRLYAPTTTSRVYRGTALDDLTLVATRGEFAASVGEVFHIVVDSGALSFTRFTLSLEEGLGSPALVNDDFADATDLGSELYLQVAGTLMGATSETAEPASGDNRTVWYKWTAPETRSVYLELSEDANISAYTGVSLATLQEVASVQSREEFAFPVSEGTIYFIRIDSLDDDEDDFRLTMEPDALTVSDNFADAIDLENGLTVGGSTGVAGATAEPGEPLHGFLPNSSVWWKWTAPATMTMEIANVAPAIYTGSSVDALTRVPVRDYGFFHAFDRRLVFDAQAGVQYHFAFHARGGLDEGLEYLQLRPAHPRAANDDFEHRLPVTPESPVTTGNLPATFEEDDPLGLGLGIRGGSHWWEFQADHSAIYELRVASAGAFRPSFTVGIYSGDRLEALTEVAIATADRSEDLTFSFVAQAGTSYAIALYQEPYQVSDLSLRRHLLPVEVSETNDLIEMHYDLSGIGLPLGFSHGGQVSQDGIQWTDVPSIPLGDERYRISVPIEASARTKLLRVVVFDE